MFTLRFDMRAKDGSGSAPDLYAAAIEMAAFAEQHGAAAVVVCEHHASPDGYLPTPLLLASALAARTTRIPIQVAALLVPLHDPIELAEVRGQDVEQLDPRHAAEPRDARDDEARPDEKGHG